MQKFLFIIPITAFTAFLFNSSGISQQLYVGANYHPHDLTIKEWKKDIALMKAGGLNSVLNVTGEGKEITMKKNSHSILCDKDYNGTSLLHLMSLNL